MTSDAGEPRSPEQHDHGEHPRLLHYAKAVGGFWRSAINDHVVEEARLHPGDVVIDIGAGLGPATIAAARSGAHVVAVDPSRLMRSGLRLRRSFSRVRSHIRILAGTAEQLPVGDRSADAVMSVNAMHHWSDLTAAATELARVVRPGGRVVLLDEDFDHEDHVLAGVAGSHHETYPMIDPDVVADLLSQAGFGSVAPMRTSVAGRPVVQITAQRPPAEPD